MFAIDFNKLPTPRVRTTVAGGLGTKMAIQEWGNPAGKPVVFAHAFGTNHLGWQAQITSRALADYRLVTFDHRGHGESEKPEDPNFYATADVWADDFEAVLKHVGEKAVVNAWSMSGSYLGDYLGKYGASRIAGINLVAASNTLGGPLFTKQAGAAFGGAQGLFSDSISDQMAASFAINKYMTAKPMDAATEIAAFGWLLMLPVAPRRVMFARDVDHREFYCRAGVPILVSHGRDDRIVLPAAAEMLKELVPAAEVSWHDAVGHSPHWEGHERFNRELAVFARRVFG
ncbi:MAG: alpha/beta hydrolase [Gemmataceae bacterium]|nr:alpha/beta hydrolase [Gemmataceae bacterium]